MNKKSNGKAIHNNKLIPSDPDMVMLGQAVESRFLDLCEAYFRIKCVELTVPAGLDRDFLHWREMRVRHNQGDLRHRESEKISTRNVAQWTLDENCKLRNQPMQVLEWGD